MSSNIHIDGDIFISKLTGKRLQAVQRLGHPSCHNCVFFKTTQCSLYAPLLLWDVGLCVDLNFTFTEVETLYDIPEELGSLIQTTLKFIYHNRKNEEEKEECEAMISILKYLLNVEYKKWENEQKININNKNYNYGR